jgi:hypothetical protein
MAVGGLYGTLIGGKAMLSGWDVVPVVGTYTCVVCFCCVCFFCFGGVVCFDCGLYVQRHVD